MVERVIQSEGDGSVASDLPRGVALLADLTTNLNTVRANFEALTEKIRDGNLKSVQGISLLELKNESLLSYMANLTYVTLRKLKGLKLENDPGIERLVENRVVLERIRPLEDKLKYQIDKHVKVATEGLVTTEDPSQLKGNLDNIGSSDDDEEEDTGQDHAMNSKKTKDDEDKLYKIPKISQKHYDGAGGSEVAKQRARKHVLNSSTLRDALHEHTEDPEVVFDTDVLKQKSMRKRKELEKYEEENFLRKTVSKRERASMRQITTLGNMGSEILSFNSLKPLRDDYDPSAPANKRQKTGSKSTKGKKGKSKGKKGFKKRKKH